MKWISKTGNSNTESVLLRIIADVGKRVDKVFEFKPALVPWHEYSFELNSQRQQKPDCWIYFVSRVEILLS